MKRLVEQWLASIPPNDEPVPRVPGSLTKLQYKFPEKVIVEKVRWASPKGHRNVPHPVNGRCSSM